MLGTALSLLIAGWSQTATPTQAKPSTSVHDVPVEVHGGYFFVEAKINDVPFKFVVDTGAGLTVINPGVAKQLGLEKGQKINAQGVGSTTVPARLEKMNTLKIGGKTVRNELAVVIDLPPILKCDGLVGYSFFKNFVVALNLDEKSLAFYPPNEGPKLPGARTFPMAIKDNVPTLPARIGGVSGVVTVDTGANGGISVHAPFVKKHDLVNKHPERVESVTGQGVGGVALGALVWIQDFQIGDWTLPPIHSDLSMATSGVFAKDSIMANIGHEVIKRFDIILDYPAQKAQLIPSKSFAAAPRVNQSGITSTFDGKNLIILAVKPDSPASKANIEVGDIIQSVDGIPVATKHPLDVHFRGPVGTNYRMTIIKSGGAKLEVIMTITDLYPIPPKLEPSNAH